MMPLRPEEVVWTATADGLRHHGLVIRPAEPDPALPAVVWVHGATLSFSDPLPVLVGRRLAMGGHTFVTGNNRGHHALVPLGFRDDGRMIAGGTWAERFSESGLDIAAWIDAAAALGASRLVLVGHSYGAAKAVCYQAEHADPRVAAVAAVSAPTRFNRALGGPEVAELAERMVAEGRGDQLLPYGSLGPRNSNSRTAAAYLDILHLPDVFGRESDDPPVSRLRCPLLAVYGSDEPHIGTDEDLDVIRHSARSASSVETRTVAGDHVYAGHEASLAEVLAAWIACLG
jgi:pimeloyl-ACP methyl ester carboxylesterase